MAFSNRVLTTTRDKFLPKVVDTVLGSNVLATKMLEKAKKWSGDKMTFPIKVSKNTTGSSFSGYDLLSTTASDTRVKLQFDPKFYSIAVSLPLDEISVNATDEKILDLIATEMQSSAQDAADDIGTQFYADGTGNGSKDFLGLAAIVDDGTTVATYGGQSRTTYTTLKSTVTASSGTVSLAKMRALKNAAGSGAQQPTLGVTTETVKALYETLLQPMQRITRSTSNDKSSVGTGFPALDFDGMPIVADEKCTSGAMYFLNENFLNWYGLPMKMTEPVNYKSVTIEGNDYSSLQGLGFSWSGWVKPANQAAIVGHVYLGGQLISENPKRHAVLTGITSV
jgi:hypothetical protein